MKQTLLLLILFTLQVHAQSTMKTITLRLTPGSDVKKELDQYVHTHHLEAACIVTAVGSLTQTVIRFADKPVADTLQGKVEVVSLTGTLSIHGSHLHISVADGTGKTTGGHLKEGSLVYTTLEIVLGIMDDVVYKREKDPRSGYNELLVVPKKK